MKTLSEAAHRRVKAYRKGHRDAMEVICRKIELLERSGAIPAAAARELREACAAPPPDLEEGPAPALKARA